MAHSISPFLMFNRGPAPQAEEALAFYMSLFPGSHLESLQRWPAGAPGREGAVMLARCVLNGQTVLASDSAIDHAFGFTPSLSLFVRCADEDELRRVCGALAEGGQLLMPVGDYGFSRLFGWVQDRYGVSWQLTWE